MVTGSPAWVTMVTETLGVGELPSAGSVRSVECCVIVV